MAASTAGAGVTGPRSGAQSRPLSLHLPSAALPLGLPRRTGRGSPLLSHASALNPRPARTPALLTRHAGSPYRPPHKQHPPLLPAGRGPAARLPWQACRRPGSARRLPHPASPPQNGASGRGPAPALTELGHVPGHRVVLLAPVERGGREAPVALAVRSRSHRAPPPPSAAPAALASAGSRAGSGPARAPARLPRGRAPRRHGRPGAETPPPGASRSPRAGGLAPQGWAQGGPCLRLPREGRGGDPGGPPRLGTPVAAGSGPLTSRRRLSAGMCLSRPQKWSLGTTLPGNKQCFFFFRER